MLPVLHFDDKKSFSEFVGKDEISQKSNPNAYSRLFITEDRRSVVKLYDGFWRSGAENNRLWIDFSGPAEKNIENIYLLSERLVHDQYPQITLPNAMISFCGQVVGYLMPYVNGVEMGDALKDSRYTHSQKIDWFNQLVDIILSLPTDVFIGDLHTQNVLIDQCGNVVLIDIDGFSIVSGHQLACPVAYVENLPSKYFDDYGRLLISRETDILCLFRMFFRFVFDGPDIIYFPHKWKFCLREYLVRRGLDKDFSYAISCLFSNNSNYCYSRMFNQWKIMNTKNEYSTFLNLAKLSEEEGLALNYLNNYII